MASPKIKELGAQKASPVLLIAVGVILVLVLGAGAYYVINGGWKTSGQQEYEYKHTTLPIMAAKHGDMEAFNEENKYRKEHGQPPLVMPVKPSSAPDPDAFKKMQEQLSKGQQGGAAAPAGQ